MGSRKCADVVGLRSRSAIDVKLSQMSGSWAGVAGSSDGMMNMGDGGAV